MKKKLIIIGINIFFLTAFLICQGISGSIIKSSYTGNAAKMWAGQSEERFVQLAVYFPQSNNFSEEKIYTLRNAIVNTMRTSVPDFDEDRRFYTDAWAAEGSYTVTGKNGSSGAEVIGVGGDFFLFHPLLLRSGSYIAPGDIMRDRIVLDYELAWKLFGSVDLAGLDVTINGKPFKIAGVIERENAFGFDKAYTGGAGLFMSYEALNAMTREQTGQNAEIISYEIVLPDLVTDFGMNMLKETLADDSLRITDNTNRFGYANLFRVIGDFGERSMKTDSVILPYWENANLYTEDWLALLLFLSMLFLVCPVVFGIIYFVKLIRALIRKIKALALIQIRKYHDRAYKRYMEKNATLHDT